MVFRRNSWDNSILGVIKDDCNYLSVITHPDYLGMEDINPYGRLKQWRNLIKN